jgi:hypothetical protein
LLASAFHGFPGGNMSVGSPLGSSPRTAAVWLLKAPI